MVRLNRSMMERYEIVDRRPKTLRAALFGIDQMMLCGAARLLDRANELGGDLGAVCIAYGKEKEQLRMQDGMFTLLIRGEGEDGSPLREERVVQSIIEVADIEKDGMNFAARPELDMLFFSMQFSPEELAAELAVLSHFLHVRFKAGLSAPRVIFLDASAVPGIVGEFQEGVAEFARLSFEDSDFIQWLKGVSFQSFLVDSLFDELSDAEFEKAQRDMNYQDSFLLWAEPQLKCVAEVDLPEELAAVCDHGDFALACEQKNRIFDSLQFLCAALGFLSGYDNAAQVMKDENLRSFIGRAFFDELLPVLPWPREEIAPLVISSFARLENAMNDVPLLHECMMVNFHRSLLPSIRAYAEREFDVPPRLTLAFSAAIMIYAGVRSGDDGEYEILRGKDKFTVRDSTCILEAFSQYAHDMPAETLSYAVLADRDLWDRDLREIDGLELRTALDIASIQRVGFRETLRQREATFNS